MSTPEYRRIASTLRKEMPRHSPEAFVARLRLARRYEALADQMERHLAEQKNG